ncbi:hypothetical protein GCM10010449_16830 [Streptomyces rectiviolaceus]|uniref:HTH tetR-type domain-containing protein n=1 Tax=Streptomyces rectiviolaceus TaxID=332591 RepID=A0ABP6MD54_9ACTN
MLDAALRLLAERPDAGMAAIATAAGVTRQTVYAHFGTRDALLDAVADRITDQAMAAMDEAEENGGPALDSLLRLQDIGWRLFEHNPVLLQLGSSRSRADGDADADQARHEPVTARLTRLIEEGQASGEFDPAPPATWLVAAVTALGHAAGAEVGAGRMPAEEAATWLRTATLALLGVGPRNSAL